jgi:hypothetical protein
MIGFCRGDALRCATDATEYPKSCVRKPNSPSRHCCISLVTLAKRKNIPGRRAYLKIPESYSFRAMGNVMMMKVIGNNSPMSGKSIFTGA